MVEAVEVIEAVEGQGAQVLPPVAVVALMGAQQVGVVEWQWVAPLVHTAA